MASGINSSTDMQSLVDSSSAAETALGKAADAVGDNTLIGLLKKIDENTDQDQQADTFNDSVSNVTDTGLSQPAPSTNVVEVVIQNRSETSMLYMRNAAGATVANSLKIPPLGIVTYTGAKALLARSFITETGETVQVFIEQSIVS